MNSSHWIIAFTGFLNGNSIALFWDAYHRTQDIFILLVYVKGRVTEMEIFYLLIH